MVLDQKENKKKVINIDYFQDVAPIHSSDILGGSNGVKGCESGG